MARRRERRRGIIGRPRNFSKRFPGDILCGIRIVLRDRNHIEGQRWNQVPASGGNQHVRGNVNAY